MARPETDDDLARELMREKDEEPTDALRFDRQGNLIAKPERKNDRQGSAAAE